MRSLRLWPLDQQRRFPEGVPGVSCSLQLETRVLLLTRVCTLLRPWNRSAGQPVGIT